MNAVTVTLNHYTPLYVASDGARTCWSSQDKSDAEPAGWYDDMMGSRWRTKDTSQPSVHLNNL